MKHQIRSYGRVSGVLQGYRKIAAAIRTIKHDPVLLIAILGLSQASRPAQKTLRVALDYRWLWPVGFQNAADSVSWDFSRYSVAPQSSSERVQLAWPPVGHADRRELHPCRSRAWMAFSALTTSAEA
jgi:hypothetical protein